MPSISYSQMSDLLGCPMIHKLKRIDKVPLGPTPVHFIKGSAVHKGAEVAINRKIATGELLPLEDTVRAAEAEFWKLANGQEIDWTSLAGGYQIPRAYAAKDVTDMTAALYQGVLSGVHQPLSAERMFKVPVKGRPGWLFIGVIDCIEKRDDGTLVTNDWKTAGSKRNFTQKKADGVGEAVVQSSAYGWLLKQVGVDAVAMRYGVVTAPKKGKASEAYVLTTPVTQAKVEAFEKLLHDCIDVIVKGEYVANPEYQYHKWCAVKGHCPMGDWVPEQTAAGLVV